MAEAKETTQAQTSTIVDDNANEFGHFTNSVSNAEAFYTHAMSELADRIVRR